MDKYMCRDRMTFQRPQRFDCRPCRCDGINSLMWLIVMGCTHFLCIGQLNSNFHISTWWTILWDVKSESGLLSRFCE